MQNQLETENLKYVDLNISPEILTIFYLSQITKIDFMTLVLVFEKIGTSLFYIFYMFSKKKISFPSEANLLKAIKFPNTVEALDNNYSHLNKILDKDKEIYQELVKLVVDRRFLRVNIESVNDSVPVPTPRVVINTNKSELNSSIKKYIRKEKRRLDKIGEMHTLFEKEHNNRLVLIDKIYTAFIDKVQESDKVEDLKVLIGNLIDNYAP